jgi:hypothetical protein
MITSTQVCTAEFSILSKPINGKNSTHDTIQPV